MSCCVEKKAVDVLPPSRVNNLLHVPAPLPIPAPAPLQPPQPPTTTQIGRLNALASRKALAEQERRVAQNSAKKLRKRAASLDDCIQIHNALSNDLKLIDSKLTSDLTALEEAAELEALPPPTTKEAIGWLGGKVWDLAAGAFSAVGALFGREDSLRTYAANGRV